MSLLSNCIFLCITWFAPHTLSLCMFVCGEKHICMFVWGCIVGSKTYSLVCFFLYHEKRVYMCSYGRALLYQRHVFHYSLVYLSCPTRNKTIMKYSVLVPTVSKLRRIRSKSLVCAYIYVYIYIMY